MAEKEAEAAPAEGAEGFTDRIADKFGEEARHLGHNFEENFPCLVEGVEHVLEEHPEVQKTLEHLAENFRENFPHLTGHVDHGTKEHGDA